MGIGAICHTVNPRLFPEQIAWVVNHAQDRIVITDITFVAVRSRSQPRCHVSGVMVVLTASAYAGDVVENAIAYEDWIAAI